MDWRENSEEAEQSPGFSLCITANNGAESFGLKLVISHKEKSAMAEASLRMVGPKALPVPSINIAPELPTRALK